MIIVIGIFALLFGLMPLAAGIFMLSKIREDNYCGNTDLVFLDCFCAFFEFVIAAGLIFVGLALIFS